MFATRPTSLAFIDSNLPDINTLVAGLPAHVEYHVLHPQLPALQQMVALCADRVGLAALHLICHGAPGELHLGNDIIDLTTLKTSRPLLHALSDAMAEEGEILLYGCEVAAGVAGRQFVDTLRSITGLNIAAATHKVGHADLGGSWELDIAPPMMQSGLQVSEWRGVLDLSNTRPVLDAKKSPTLGTITANLAAPTNGSTTGGILVSSLIDTVDDSGLDNYTDADSNPAGIAITGVDAHGTLYYSTDNGDHWTALTDPVSAASALTLFADANTYVYFKPEADFTGDLIGAITFKAWDQTGGFTNGQTGVNTGPYGLEIYRTEIIDDTPYVTDVAVGGNYAYVADYSYLNVFDVSNPAQPTLVTNVPVSAAKKILIDGSYAYVSSFIGLSIVDISNLLNIPQPVTLNGITIGSNLLFLNATDVAIVGNYAYVADAKQGLVVVNISDKTNPFGVYTY